jgi:serine/threonine protein phosphatase 1
MVSRTIAIGDIHGCVAALDAVLDAIGPTADDRLIVLGDYVDRGPDSRGVVERLLELGRHTPTVTLLGNHEEMLLASCEDDQELQAWLSFGGAETLASYRAEHPRELPEAHLRFIEANCNFAESDRHFFAHANYLAELPLDEQPWNTLRWESLWQRIPPQHTSGKQAIVGHTAQRDGEIWDLGHLRCIDTYCHGGRWLTALDVESGYIWQADREGTMRSVRDPNLR